MNQQPLDTPVMQASNIDEQGNVLYLDEERLARKVVGFPKWKNRSNAARVNSSCKFIH